MKFTLMPLTREELEMQKMPDGVNHGLVELEKFPYPDARKKKFKGKPAYDRSKLDEALKKRFEVKKDEIHRVILAGEKSDSYLAVYFELGEWVGSSYPELERFMLVEDYVRTMLNIVFNSSSDLGFLQKSDFKKSGLVIDCDRFGKFLAECLPNKAQYKGLGGMIKMAGELGGIHLGQLYSLISALNLAGELEWQKVDMPYSDVQVVCDKLNTNKAQYKGLDGMIKMAGELGGMNLGHLYSLISALNLAGELEWQKVNIPYGDVQVVCDKLDTNKAQYKGLGGMIKMAGELGGIHLGQLYSLISALNLAGELEWQYVDMPYSDVQVVCDKLNTNKAQYKGLGGMIKMASELGGIHLGQLYSFISALNLAGELEWQKVDMPYSDVQVVCDKLNKDKAQYKGLGGMIKMAGELGGMNLGQLYSLISALNLAGELEWQVVNMPYGDVQVVCDKLNTNKAQYKGLDGMIKMAGELGGIHLGHLYSLISALNLAGELEWQYVNMPYSDVQVVCDKLNTNKAQYKGLGGMIKMAGELGGIHLGHLYSLISALNLAGELEWQYVNMPYREYLMSL